MLCNVIQDVSVYVYLAFMNSSCLLCVSVRSHESVKVPSLLQPPKQNIVWRQSLWWRIKRITLWQITRSLSHPSA